MRFADILTFVYDQLIDAGTMPSIADVAAHCASTREQLHASIAAASVGKALLIHPATGDLWMAGPFAAEPTAYRVSAGTRAWWANCAWDMLGIAAIVGEPVSIAASCTDCGERMHLQVAPTDNAISTAVVHFLVPARRWYDDIGFT